MPELPQSIQAANVFHVRAPAVDSGSFQDQPLSKNNSFQCQSSPNRSRQLQRSNPYLKITVFNARAHPVDPGSFQDQILPKRVERALTFHPKCHPRTAPRLLYRRLEDTSLQRPRDIISERPRGTKIAQKTTRNDIQWHSERVLLPFRVIRALLGPFGVVLVAS